MITDTTTAMASGAGRAGRRMSSRHIAVVSLALAVTGLVGGCSSSDESAEQATTTTSTVAGQAPATNAPANGGGSTGNGQTSGGGQSTGSTSPPSGPAPVITTFVTPDDIDCHNGNFQMFSASWTTTNAVKVTISIDGQGIYKTYDANGSDSLPFNCSTSHSFLLTAYGQDGQTATKTITLQPRDVQPTTT